MGIIGPSAEEENLSLFSMMIKLVKLIKSSIKMPISYVINC
jgi:hypothetical protein